MWRSVWGLPMVNVLGIHTNLIPIEICFHIKKKRLLHIHNQRDEFYMQHTFESEGSTNFIISMAMASSCSTVSGARSDGCTGMRSAHKADPWREWASSRVLRCLSIWQTKLKSWLLIFSYKFLLNCICKAGNQVKCVIAMLLSKDSQNQI